MNSKIVFALFFSLLGLTINLQAQTDAKQKQADEKERQRLIQEFRQKRTHAIVKGKSVQVQTDRYNHREAEISAKLNTGEIPNDFPVYKSEYSNEQYTILMNKWYAANPGLLKKESSNEQK